MEFIIITGMSGSGKSTAINALEDIGFYCVDNVPPQLIPEFVELINAGKIAPPNGKSAAFVTDIRGGELFLSLNETANKLKTSGKKSGYSVKVLFLDASDETIKNRYKETRRRHPLFIIADEDMDKAVSAERDMLAPIMETADFRIDTSLLSSAGLKEAVLNVFMDKVSDSMLINCVSFGFKYGVPSDADLVFDVRCLPNPFYVPELKHKTGLDEEVRDFVMNGEVSSELEKRLFDLIGFLAPLYVAEGKSGLSIAFGCTGGKHRSVTFAENARNFLAGQGFNTKSFHRDIKR